MSDILLWEVTWRAKPRPPVVSFPIELRIVVGISGKLALKFNQSRFNLVQTPSMDLTGRVRA